MSAVEVERGSGIYAIENRRDGMMYVGATAYGLAFAWTQHRTLLSRGIHSNRLLQAAWDSGSPDDFHVIILEPRSEWSGWAMGDAKRQHLERHRGHLYNMSMRGVPKPWMPNDQAE